MNALKRLERLDLRVSWKTVWVGWHGPMENERQIDGQQVIEFALECMSRNPKVANEVVLLASLSPQELDQVSDLLARLASGDDSSVDLEVRKWRLLLLHDCMNELSEDPLYAWLAVAEFWGAFGFPEDSPMFFQKFGNSNRPQNYDESFYQELTQSHLEWWRAESESLKMLDQGRRF